MSIEQICILLCILQILVMVIVMLVCANVPDKNKKWNLNVMLQGMTDQGVLWIVAALYLFIIILMEIVIIVGAPEHLRDARYPWIVIGFPFLSIGTLVGVSLLITRESQKKDYVKTLLHNFLPYANCKSDELEAVLENEIKDGRRVEMSFNNLASYKFIAMINYCNIPIKW